MPQLQVQQAYCAVKVTKGVAQTAEAVEPFQYYTEPGETIYCLYHPRQSGLSKYFLHVDAKGNPLTSFTTSEMDGENSSQIIFDVARMEQHRPIEGNFVDLLRDLHLAAANGNGRIFQYEERDQVLNLFPEQPIIVGGCGRSGTTLLLSVLGAHSNVYAISDEIYPFYPFPFRLTKLLRELQGGVNRDFGRWCEKTPKNVRAFGQILEVFEEKMKIVHMVRDGRDVVTSHHPNHEERYWVTPERWVADVQAGLEFRDQVYLLKYEDLVSNPEVTIRSLCEFLELNFEQTMLEPEKYSRIQENVAWQGRKVFKVNADAMGRWKQEEHQERVEEFYKFPGCVSLMKELGYL
jgi:hypothetical protein